MDFYVSFYSIWQLKDVHTILYNQDVLELSCTEILSKTDEGIKEQIFFDEYKFQLIDTQEYRIYIHRRSRTS